MFKTTGDGFLAVFGSAGEALDAAVAIQDGFAGRPLQLRIGLNLGDVIQEDGDVFGDGVNVAARLEAMAEPGGVYASAAVVRGDRQAARPALRAGSATGAARTCPTRSRSTRCARGAGRRGRWLGAGGRWPRRRPWRCSPSVPLAGAMASTCSAPLARAPAGLGAAPSPPDADNRPAVAVLPFDNLSGDPAQGYFSDGLTEDIITELARNRELMVIARNSTFAFKDRPTDIREVGAKLGARYVVEGSTRRAGDQLRVVAQLIDAETGAHLWSRSYDRRVEDVFAVQTDVTRQIVASLVSYVREFGIGGGGRAADRVAAGLRAGAAGPRALPARQGRPGGDARGARAVRPRGRARSRLCRGPRPSRPDLHRRAHERGGARRRAAATSRPGWRRRARRSAWSPTWRWPTRC